jgi:hypothetical protein
LIPFPVTVPVPVPAVTTVSGNVVTAPTTVVTLAELVVVFVLLAAVTVAVFVRVPFAGKLTLYMIVILAPFASVLKPQPTIH